MLDKHRNQGLNKNLTALGSNRYLGLGNNNLSLELDIHIQVIDRFLPALDRSTLENMVLGMGS